MEKAASYLRVRGGAKSDNQAPETQVWQTRMFVASLLLFVDEKCSVEVVQNFLSSTSKIGELLIKLPPNLSDLVVGVVN